MNQFGLFAFVASTKLIPCNFCVDTTQHFLQQFKVKLQVCYEMKEFVSIIKIRDSEPRTILYISFFFAAALNGEKTIIHVGIYVL